VPKLPTLGSTYNLLDNSEAFPKMANLVRTTIFIFLFFISPWYIVLADLRPEIGTHTLGMGGASVGYSDELTGTICNPANLAIIRNANLMYELSQGALLLNYRFRNFGNLGISVIDMDNTDRFMDSDPNNPIGTFQFGDNTVLFSYAGRVQRFMLGMNLGLNRTRNANSLWQPNIDIGGIAEIKPNLFAGISFINFAGTNIYDKENNLLKKYRQQFSLGLSWLPEEHLQLSMDWDTARAKLRLGTQVSINWLTLRLGSITNLDKNRTWNWSAGFSLKYNKFRINYAYLDDDEITYKHMLSFGYRLGGKKKQKNNDENSSDISSSKNNSVIPKLEPRPELVHPDDIHTKGKLESLSRKYDIEIPLVLAVVKTESGFNPEAISRVGAVGLMQLMPATARELGLKVPKYRNIKKPKIDARIDERFDPQKNLEAGLNYLCRMLKMYDGNYVLAIAAYNAGPGNVRKDVPLIDETERHVGKVLNYYYSYKNFPDKKQKDLAILNSILE